MILKEKELLQSEKTPENFEQQAGVVIGNVLKSPSPLLAIEELSVFLPYFVGHEELAQLHAAGRNSELIVYCLPTLGKVVDRYLGFGMTERELARRAFLSLVETVEAWETDKQSPSGRPKYLKQLVNLEATRCLREKIIEAHGLPGGNSDNFDLVALYRRCLAKFQEKEGRLPNLTEITTLVEERNEDGLSLRYSGEEEGNDCKSKVEIIYRALGSENIDYQEARVQDESDPLSQLGEKLFEKDLRNLLFGLFPFERRVLELSFGFKERKMTVEEISRILNLTPGEVRQAKVRGLRKLRHPRKSGRLRPF